MNKTLTKYTPKNLRKPERFFPSLFEGVDSLFDFPFFGSFPILPTEYWRKTNNEYNIEINLPKYKKENVSASVENGFLVVEGKQEKSPFYFQISVPASLDMESLKARLEDGVLTVSGKSLISSKGTQILIE